MSGTINKLQVRKARFDSSKMIDLNHWTTNLGLKPEVFLPAHRKIFASRTNSLDFGKDNVLESLFGLGKTKYVDSLNWSWKMEVDGFRPITILENRTVTETPGRGRQPIEVLVDVDLAQIGETWSPGSSDKSQVAIVVNKRAEGTRGFVYQLQTSTEGFDHYINKKYLEPGSKWTRMYTQRGEAAESGGFAEGTSHVEYKSNLVKLRKEYKVTDYGAQAVLQIDFEYNGKKYSSWMEMQDARYHMEMNRELTQYALYSRLSDTPLKDPDSGYPIVPGAGLQQQIEFGGNVERYTNLSVDLVEAFMDRMVFSRISPGDLGEVVGMTGYYGMRDMHKAITKWVGEDALITDSNLLIEKDPKGYHQNSLVAGYQFTAWRLHNGGIFRLIHNPMNDDKRIHRDIDRTTGNPLESGRITILDITGGSGESINPKDNIRLVRKNKVYGSTVIPGRVGPGGTIVKNPTHSGDYYEVHISDSVGVEVIDASCTGELVKEG